MSVAFTCKYDWQFGNWFSLLFLISENMKKCSVFYTCSLRVFAVGPRWEYDTYSGVCLCSELSDMFVTHHRTAPWCATCSIYRIIYTWCWYMNRIIYIYVYDVYKLCTCTWYIYIYIYMYIYIYTYCTCTCTQFVLAVELTGPKRLYIGCCHVWAGPPANCAKQKCHVWTFMLETQVDMKPMKCGCL